ncbi:MAG: isoprenylcysteine carboxylmethyltransferase family protein [Candidatus Pacebacteria bacterium]|nr:isoprenylcysteine carboxylmethyltransferase family protein [Candidatus Paceibacterota bacterium]
METKTNTENQKLSQKGKIHFVLSHSYIVFLFAVVLGVVIDIIIPLNIFSGEIYQTIGLMMIILGSALIYWAQSTSSPQKNKTGFENGPYKYFKSPTHIGLFVMTLGLGLLINSPFSVFFTVLAGFIAKLLFLKRQEKILEEKYGDDYRNYKNRTKK